MRLTKQIKLDILFNYQERVIKTKKAEYEKLYQALHKIMDSVYSTYLAYQLEAVKTITPDTKFLIKEFTTLSMPVFTSVLNKEVKAPKTLINFTQPPYFPLMCSTALTKEKSYLDLSFEGYYNKLVSSRPFVLSASTQDYSFSKSYPLLKGHINYTPKDIYANGGYDYHILPEALGPAQYEVLEMFIEEYKKAFSAIITFNNQILDNFTEVARILSIVNTDKVLLEQWPDIASLIPKPNKALPTVIPINSTNIANTLANLP